MNEYIVKAGETSIPIEARSYASAIKKLRKKHPELAYARGLSIQISRGKQ